MSYLKAVPHILTIDPYFSSTYREGYNVTTIKHFHEWNSDLGQICLNL